MYDQQWYKETREFLVVLMLKVLKREICEKLQGRFSYLNPKKVRTIPEEQAIALTIEYRFKGRRTPEQWANLCVQEMEKAHPANEFIILRATELEVDWLSPKIFEAVIQVK